MFWRIEMNVGINQARNQIPATAVDRETSTRDMDSSGCTDLCYSTVFYQDRLITESAVASHGNDVDVGDCDRGFNFPAMQRKSQQQRKDGTEEAAQTHDAPVFYLVCNARTFSPNFPRPW